MQLNMNKMLSFICITFLISCKQETKSIKLQEGDILFQKLKCGELCDAINKVTDGYKGEDYAHCALVVSINDTLKVVEAIGSKVQINTIQNFYKRSNDTLDVKNILVGRLKKEYQNLIPVATKNSLTYVGLPYDDVFEINNGKMYCSEILYEAFKTANNNQDFFPLAPMTFNDPDTKQPFNAWVEYYKSLNYEIPEGKPGLNPGGISLSDKIEIVE